MKKSFLFTLTVCSFLNAGLFDFFQKKEETKKEEVQEKIIEEKVVIAKCFVLEKVLDTSIINGIHYGTTVTGTTSCDSATLTYRFSCDNTLISIESGYSFNGTFSHFFSKAECFVPLVEVSVK